jgi:Flp pilus assembly protein TadG
MSILKQGLFERFRRDSRGNVVVIFALALVPLLGFVGAAVDYSRAAMIHGRLQSAVDATALKLTRDGAKLDQSGMLTMAQRYFNAVFDRTDTNIKPSIAIATADQKVTLSVTTSVPTVFMPLLGIMKMDVAASAVSTYDKTKIELTLVLDNTGSMGQSNKMVELKKATNALLSSISQLDPDGSRIRVAIVPFDTQVNVGTSYQWKAGKTYQHADWLGFSDAGTHFVATRYWNGAADPNKAWPGCVDDRYQPNDTQATVPIVSSNDTASRDTLYPATNCVNTDRYGNYTLGTIQPLTSNQTLLTKAVAAMQPSGNTNVTIGFHWGLRMLESGTTPLGLGAPLGTLGVKKYLVLLTDGDNTQNRYGEGSSKIDTRTKAMCSTIKDTGAITVYTVRVMDGNASMLSQCASPVNAANPQTYFDVSNAQGISAVFQTILNNITGIRLTS